MNSISRFLIEAFESRRIEGQLKRKLTQLEIARLEGSPAELKDKMNELDNIAWQANGFNKGMLFYGGDLPLSVNFIDMRYYKKRINSLKENLEYKQNNQPCT
jgi:hypothetical protein